MPWEWLILAVLGDGQEASLEDIYISIEEMYHDLKTQDGTQMINPDLFKVDLRWGDRPRLTHAVRASLSKFKKAGLVEHVARGIYRLTKVGKERLRWYQGEY